MNQQQQKVAARIEQLQTFLNDTPNDPFLRYALALEYLKIDQAEHSLQLFIELTQTNPNYVGTYYHLGKLQQQLQQYDEALATFEQGMTVAQHQKDNHSYSELSNALDELEDLLEEQE